MKNLASSFGKNRIFKTILSVFVLAAMLVPTFGSVAQASVFEGGIGNIESVENNSGSTAGNRLNLGGQSHKVDISVKERSLTLNFLGKPRLTGVVRIPTELKGLVKSGGNATLTGAISLDGQDQAWMVGIKNTIEAIRTRIVTFGEEIVNKGFNVNVNINEVIDTLNLGDGIINLGKGTFDMGEVKIAADGSYAYIDSQYGAADFVAKSINDILDNVAAAIEKLEITSTNLGDFPNLVESVGTAALAELKVELLGVNSSNPGLIQNAKDIVAGIGGAVNSLGSVSFLGSTEIKFPLEIQDPLYHAKDANGKNLFLPANVDELSYEELQNLTAKQTQYDAKFVGLFDRADWVNAHVDLADYISDHSKELLGTNDHTTIYYGFGQTAGHRVAGPDRYATAAQVSARSFKTADTVVLVNGQSYVDVAPATVLAAKQKAPVLLTQANILPEVTKAEIARLGATNVIVVGGQNAVADAIVADYSVDRITGADRFETAANVAAKVGSKSNKAVVVNSDAWADALVITAVAIKEDAPIIFTDAKALPETSVKAIENLKANTVFVGGGEDTVGKGVLNALEVDTVERLAGADRFATAVVVANKAYPEAKYAVATNGLDYIDALVAAPYAALNEAPVVLVTPAAVPPATATYVSTLNRVTVVGGPNSVADSVLTQLTEMAVAK